MVVVREEGEKKNRRRGACGETEKKSALAGLPLRPKHAQRSRANWQNASSSPSFFYIVKAHDFSFLVARREREADRVDSDEERERGKEEQCVTFRHQAGKKGARRRRKASRSASNFAPALLLYRPAGVADRIKNIPSVNHG